jgi:hypothetical protein
MKMNNLFDTNYEIAMQCLITLNTLKQKSLSTDRLWLINFLSLYAKDFNFSDNNLNGDSIYSKVQLSMKREKIKEAILLLITKNLIRFDDIQSINFTITESGQKLVEKINSNFSIAYREATKNVCKSVKNMSDIELLDFTYKLIINKE